MSTLDIETFYRHLGALRSKGYTPFFHEDAWIRLLHPDISVHRHFCPLTAVCHSLTGTHYKTAEHRDAAREIHLDPDFEVEYIRLAADHQGHPDIRKKLLQALDLKEVT